MSEEILVNEQDTYENEDVKNMQAMQARFDEELAKKDQKYSALLKYVTEGGKVSPETATPELSLEEKWNNACKIVNDKRASNIEIAQALLTGDEIYRSLHNDRSIFCSEDGTLSDKEEKIADMTKAIMEDAISKAEGDSKVYTSLAAGKLTQ